MTASRTLDFKGRKNVDCVDTGHSKTRLTVGLGVAMSGAKMKSLIILKVNGFATFGNKFIKMSFQGLKKVPNLTIPSNVVVDVAKGGSMTETVMLNWIQNVYFSRGPYYFNRKSLLVLDHCAAHKTVAVADKLKEINTSVVFVPKKQTHLLQPLDVSVMVQFKSEMRALYNVWQKSATPRYTAAQNRCRPSYQEIVDMVSSATKAIDRATIRKGFISCGFTVSGRANPDNYNRRLKVILGQTVPLDYVIESSSSSSEDEEFE